MKKSLILVPFLIYHFTMHSAALSDPVKPFNVHKLISVAQGESKMPYQIAYRPVGPNKLLACLVADPQLDELFPGVDIAQATVDAIPELHLDFSPLDKRAYDDNKVQLSKICTQALKEGKGHSRLIAMFKIWKKNPAYSEQPSFALSSLWNGAEISINYIFTCHQEVSFSLKAYPADAIVYDCPKSKKYSDLAGELQRRGEQPAASNDWEERVKTSGHDFVFKILGRDVAEYFAQQARLAQASSSQSTECASCSIL